MKRLTALIAASLVLAIGLTAQAQIPYYFDINDDALGSGVGAIDGTAVAWNTTGIGWNTINSDGTQASPGLNVAWVNGNDAVFSAGTDASVPGSDPNKGVVYGFQIAAGIQSRDSIIEEGVVQVASGSFDATREILVKPNAALRSAASSQFPHGGGRITLQGTSLTDAGEFQARNAGSAGSMFTSGLATGVGKEIHIDGFGRISYDDGDGIADNKVSIIVRQWITGEGGTPANGGAGTLIKSGPDQVGFTSFADPNTGIWNYTLNSFAKLRVEQGGFRLRLSAGVGADERMFGAVPLATLTDAITLDGGGFGTNTTITLSALRGVTILNSAGNNLNTLFGAGGGYLDSGAGAGLNIPGPLTAAAGVTLYVGDPTTTSTASPTFQLSNANNTATFLGNIVMKQGTLQLNSNLTAAKFEGTGQNAAVGIVNLNGAAVVFTAGDASDTSWDGRATGTGAFTKVGAGTLTLNPAASEWTNTGGVNINQGTIKYGTSAAGFSSAVTVTIASGAKLNMAGVNDTFGALSGPAGGTVDMNDGGAAATPSNLTLAAATPVITTYGGTITGGGNLTKSSSSTQKFSGNLSLGTVALNGGFTMVNGPATMTATGGVTVATTGALGGTGIIAGAVTNNGVLAPGDGGIGTLSVTGNVTAGATSTLHAEILNATSDMLAVTGNIDLSAAGEFLSVTGAGTGSSWVIGSYTGTLTGIFDNVTSGYTVNYGDGTNDVITLTAAPACAPGDANCDGNFNAQDYALIRKANSDITSGAGLTEYTAWRAAYTGTPGSGSGGGLGGGAVPEPTSIVLLLSSLGYVFAGRRRTR